MNQAEFFEKYGDRTLRVEANSMGGELTFEMIYQAFSERVMEEITEPSPIEGKVVEEDTGVALSVEAPSTNKFAFIDRE